VVFAEEYMQNIQKIKEKNGKIPALQPPIQSIRDAIQLSQKTCDAIEPYWATLWPEKVLSQTWYNTKQYNTIQCNTIRYNALI